MKLKYLLTALLASSFAFIGCEDEKVGYLDNIKLSESYMSMPVNGGKITLDIDANVDWEFVTNDNWPDVIVRDNKTGEIKSQTPSWRNVRKGRQEHRYIHCCRVSRWT